MYHSVHSVSTVGPPRCYHSTDVRQGVFATRNLDLTISSQSIVALEVDVEDLDAEVESQSILTLSGNADDFDLSLDTQSIVNAEDLKSGVINVQANHQSVET